MQRMPKVLWLAVVLSLLIAPVSFPGAAALAQTSANSGTDEGVSVQNAPPQLSCPKDDSVHIRDTFKSTAFSVIDPDGDAVTVEFLDIFPSAPVNPSIVRTHVEWWTATTKTGDYSIRLQATDSQGLKDTCEFTVTVWNRPAQITCPPDDSIQAGQTFVSEDASVFDPDGDPVTIRILRIDPKPTYQPVLVDKHVEWVTTPAEEGDYLITLLAVEFCNPVDTCEFTVTVLPGGPGDLTCPEDDSVHATVPSVTFVSTDFFITGPGTDPSDVTLFRVEPAPVNMPFITGSHVEWLTHCDDAGKNFRQTFRIWLEAPVGGGVHDTCYFEVTVYNRPPELTCPEDELVYAGSTFVSTDFSVTDPDEDSAPVSILDINPPPTNNPTIVDSHVEWVTASGEEGDYIIRLVATDPCELADTCDFTVTVVSGPTNTLTCPEDDSVHATVPAVTFVSTNFSVTGPGADPSRVQVISIDPAPAAGMPYREESHIEWLTDCDDAGKTFTICLEATFDVGPNQSCCFEVIVYNRPPELICPGNDTLYAGETFISSDFSVSDPDGDPAPVTFLDIDPPATNDPTIVGSHVKWVTTFSDSGDYDIRLVATDPCELADTCDFTVTVVKGTTGDLVCPEDDSIHATDPPLTFVSTDFTITGPGTDPSQVDVWKVEPPPVNWPRIEESHVEWLTDCDDADKTFTIWLEAPVGGGERDTCNFQVVVYNRPPVLTCPDYGHIAPNKTFASTDFSVFDPDDDPVDVTLESIRPTPTYQPVIVDKHVEWRTKCSDAGKDYIIQLVATDPCSLADTCEFTVSVSYSPAPDFYIWVFPVAQNVPAGQTADYLVELYSLYGFAQPCSLFVTGLPDPPNNGFFDQAVLTPTGHTKLHVQTAAQTPSGTYTLTFTAKQIGGAVQHAVQLHLDVDARADGSVLAGESKSEEGTAPREQADRSGFAEGFTLFQNQPNPFNPETRLSYYLPRPSRVEFAVYNVLGRRVKTLFCGYQGAGLQTVTWDGRDDQGLALSSGIYFYRLQAGAFCETKKMILTK
jgi:hypothetical protein